MYRTAFVISLLLSLGASAAQKSQPPPAADQCGPTVQVPTDPKDSCTTKPAVVNAAAAFGILESNGLPGGPPGIYDWANCDATVNLICDEMKSPNGSFSGIWHFKSGPRGKVPPNPCHMGFYIPNTDGAAAAPPQLPGNDQCTNIFTTMVEAAKTASFVAIGYSFVQTNWTGASINLVMNPASPPAPIQLPGGQGTGAAFNAGYPSYVMAWDPAFHEPPPEPEVCVNGRNETCPCDSGSAVHECNLYIALESGNS